MNGSIKMYNEGVSYMSTISDCFLPGYTGKLHFTASIAISGVCALVLVSYM